MKKLYLLSALPDDFDHTIVDAAIPDDELEYSVTETAVRLFPQSEHVYYYDALGNFTADIITNGHCINRLVYC